MDKSDLKSQVPDLSVPSVPGGSQEDLAELVALEAKINAILPPQYQDRCDEVKPTSMGSAGLKFGPDGKVAWDQIWTHFCDLALAGGPPHRGTLLEPASPAEVRAGAAGLPCRCGRNRLRYLAGDKTSGLAADRSRMDGGPLPWRGDGQLARPCHHSGERYGTA